MRKPEESWARKKMCHPACPGLPWDRSEAQWRDLLFIIHNIEFEWKRCPPLCHPDRSEAEWRDLQFNGPLVEMFSDRTVSPI